MAYMIYEKINCARLSFIQDVGLSESVQIFVAHQNDYYTNFSRSSTSLLHYVQLVP